ncbi:MAG: NAD(P)-dependent alcohol dehydrogenase [Chloroflexi bacterium]|nr:NAD(P)-dependent alcohol dehydrogenase [Chloroflexota bacterium]
MKAIMRSSYGPPGGLTLRDVDMPRVGKGQLLVRVRAASLNAGDLDYLYGRPPMARLAIGLRGPRNRRLGLDVAGEVEAIGKGVTRFQVGDAVFGDMTQAGFGAFAEYVSAPQNAFAPKPASLTFEQAATVPQAAVLAMQGLSGGRPIRSGQRVLINGASGSVGPFAVQIAKAFGAEVTGVCSTAKMDLVRSAGADHVIDYTAVDFTRAGQRYDRILDISARRSLLATRRVLNPGGTYVLIGGSTLRVLESVILGPLISIAGSRRMGIDWSWKPMRPETVAALTKLIDSGAVRPMIDRSYPLSELPAALRYLEQGHARGKIVIAT